MRTRTIARTGALNLLLQILVLLAIYAVGHERPLAATGTARVFVLLLAVLVPSAIWALFFYLQDRRQPEPTANVVMAFAAGAGAAAAVLLPAEAGLFRLGEWMYRSPWWLLMGATFVRGAIISVLFYVIIRYGFMPADDFDEPADGMAYGAFIGSGFAAASSLAQIASSPDFTLFWLSYTAAKNVLVYASIGALAGYLVGRAKFQVRPAAYSYAEEILIVAGLIGLYHVLAEYAFVEESANVVWISVAAALMFSMAVLGLATWLMYRLTVRAEHRSRLATRAVDPLAVVAAAALLIVGVAATWRALKPVTFESEGLSFVYEATLVPALAAAGASKPPVTQASFGSSAEPQVLTDPPIFIVNSKDGSSLTIRAHAGSASIDQINPLSFAGADPLGLRITEISAAGRAALRVRYAYLTHGDATTMELPQVRWALTDIVPTASRTYVLTLDASPEASALAERRYERLLGTLRWPTQ